MAQEPPQGELVEHYRLETRFGKASVGHTIYSPLTHIEKWRRAQVIGRGGFGTVHLEHGPKNRVRAVKVINKTTSPPAFDHTRELFIMSFLTKHHVSLFVQFLGWFESSEKLYIAMEYLEKGDLRRHLDGQMSAPMAKLLASQLLEGLNFMHMNGIAHRDIKPENIFVVSLSPLRVKLGDFGVSKRINEHTKLRTQVSTRSYSAPEILGALESSLETSEYTHAVDIWSLGCVMFEVLTGSVLFRMECSVWPFCYGKDGPMLEPLKEAMSEEGGFEFVRGLLSPDPMGRPSAGEALDDPWLKVPKIRRAREGGGMPAHAAVRSQACIRELLLPTFPGLFPRVFRFGKPLENPLGLRGHSRLQLRRALKISPEEPPAAQFGFLFSPDLGLLLVHGAFRLIFKSLLPRQKPPAAGGKGGGSRFADLSTLGALVFYFSTAALRGIGKGGVGHVGGKSGESGSKRRRLNGGRQTTKRRNDLYSPREKVCPRPLAMRLLNPPTPQRLGGQPFSLGEYGTKRPELKPHKRQIANTQLREGSSSLNCSLMPTTHDAQQTKLIAKKGADTKTAKPSSAHPTPSHIRLFQAHVPSGPATIPGAYPQRLLKR